MQRILLFTFVFFQLNICIAGCPSIISSEFNSQNKFQSQYELIPEDSMNGASDSVNRSYLSDLSLTCQWIHNYHFSDAEFSPNELVAIYAYTRDLYKIINPKLRNKEDLSNISSILTSLDSALHKFPTYEGWVIRGTYLPEAVLGTYNEGHIVSDAAYLSTSVDTSQETSYISVNPHRLRIHSKSGRDISQISRFPLEREVLFPRGTKFKVLKRQDIGKGSVEIDLEEI